MRSLRNDEFVSFYNEIVDIYDSVETEIVSEYFTQALEKVKQRRTDLRQIRTKERGHYLTLDINVLNEMRVDAIRMIFAEQKSKMYHTSDEVRATAVRVAFWLRKHIGRLPNASQDSLTTRINELFGDLDRNTEMAEAVELLGWATHFEGLEQLNEQYLQVRYNRMDAEADRKIDDEKSFIVREKLYKELSVLLDMTCSIVNTQGIDIAKKLIVMLDVAFDRMITIVKLRAAVGKNKGAKIDNSLNESDRDAEDDYSEEQSA